MSELVQQIPDEVKIVEVFKSCEVKKLLIGSRVGGYGTDWGIVSAEDEARTLVWWSKNAGGFTQDDPYSVRCEATTEDENFDFNPVFQDSEGTRHSITKFVIWKDNINFEVVSETRRGVRNVGLKTLDDMFSFLQGQTS